MASRALWCWVWWLEQNRRPPWLWCLNGAAGERVEREEEASSGFPSHKNSGFMWILVSHEAGGQASGEKALASRSHPPVLTARGGERGSHPHPGRPTGAQHVSKWATATLLLCLTWTRTQGPVESGSLRQRRRGGGLAPAWGRSFPASAPPPESRGHRLSLLSLDRDAVTTGTSPCRPAPRWWLAAVKGGERSPCSSVP